MRWIKKSTHFLRIELGSPNLSPPHFNFVIQIQFYSVTIYFVKVRIKTPCIFNCVKQPLVNLYDNETAWIKVRTTELGRMPGMSRRIFLEQLALFHSLPIFQNIDEKEPRKLARYVCSTCYYGEMRDVSMWRMKNKSVHSCQFFPHAKIHCIMATLNKLFKNEFESAETEKEPRNLARYCDSITRSRSILWYFKFFKLYLFWNEYCLWNEW